MSIGKIPQGENDVILRLKWRSQCDTGLIACLCVESPSNPMDARVRSMHRAHHAAVGGMSFSAQPCGFEHVFHDVTSTAKPANSGHYETMG
jgi:hypothetical protein